MTKRSQTLLLLVVLIVVVALEALSHLLMALDIQQKAIHLAIHFIALGIAVPVLAITVLKKPEEEGNE